MAKKIRVIKKADSRKKVSPAGSKGMAGASPIPRDRLLQLQHQYGNAAMRRMHKSGLLHTKLNSGPSGGKYEQEADSVAERVMTMPEPEISRKKDKEEEVQSSPLTESITPLVQRDAVPEDEEKTAQAKGDGGGPVTASVESGINSLRGSGQPLSESSRAFFEPRYGADFSTVKVHTDSNANHLAKSVNAEAFTLGSDIVFASGQYAPESTNGKRLMAHELTHVVQQQGKDNLKRSNKNNKTLQRQDKEEEILPKDIVDPSLIKLLKLKNPTPPPNSKRANKYRENAKYYMTQMKIFNNSLYMESHNRLSTIERLLNLQNDDIKSIVLKRLVSELFEAFGEAGGKYTVMAEVLKVAWDSYAQYVNASTANKVSVQFHLLSQMQSKAFKESIINIQKIDDALDSNYELLAYIGKLKWTVENVKKLGPITRAYEISLWKKTLPLKWKHMKSEKTFHTSIGWIPKFHQKNPYHLKTYKKGVKKNYLLFWETSRQKGYWVTEHWLGSGGSPLLHSTPDKALNKYLFVTLGVSKKEVFKKWGLPVQTYRIPEMYGP